MKPIISKCLSLCSEILSLLIFADWASQAFPHPHWLATGTTCAFQPLLQNGNLLSISNAMHLKGWPALLREDIWNVLQIVHLSIQNIKYSQFYGIYFIFTLYSPVAYFVLYFILTRTLGWQCIFWRAKTPQTLCYLICRPQVPEDVSYYVLPYPFYAQPRTKFLTELLVGLNFSSDTEELLSLPSDTFPFVS